MSLVTLCQVDVNNVVAKAVTLINQWLGDTTNHLQVCARTKQKSCPVTKAAGPL